ncbi:hypothetical protein [Paraconexibacter algicola]|uniref:Universal stress protein n=1 Tax=Paraconexibacter algicola TaxID=2133960 RepID=A0A2T4UG41_9ACTN|nr:hypothetical protein [Paraconexibacter algicola]PTL58211.1 hypothetical protein C7Y72_00380 [Paraconexibacter algicola]
MGPTTAQILVVANRTCPCPGLVDVIHDRVERAPAADVRIVAPALNSRLRHAFSDVDGALLQAQGRLEEVVAVLRQRGIQAAGEVGDADPFLAVADALALRPATEILVSTHPPGASNWMERGLVERLRATYGVPVTHLVSQAGLVLA